MEKRAKRTWLLQFVPVLAIALLVLSDAKPVSAKCFIPLRTCFREARYGSDWDRFLRGLDCELDFITCLRTAIFGR